jgi:hypothetical protein
MYEYMEGVVILSAQVREVVVDGQRMRGRGGDWVRGRMMAQRRNGARA